MTISKEARQQFRRRLEGPLNGGSLLPQNEITKILAGKNISDPTQELIEAVHKLQRVATQNALNIDLLTAVNDCMHGVERVKIKSPEADLGSDQVPRAVFELQDRLRTTARLSPERVKAVSRSVLKTILFMQRNGLTSYDNVDSRFK